MSIRPLTERLNDEELTQYEDAMDACRFYLRQRDIELRPMFNDYDRNKRGHVSQTQFQQILTFADLGMTAQQVRMKQMDSVSLTVIV